MLQALSLLLLLIALIGAVMFYNRKQKEAGASEVVNRQSKELQDVLKKDKIAVDKLRSDPVERKRVRDKYTRRP